MTSSSLCISDTCFHRTTGIKALTSDCIFGVPQNPNAPFGLAFSGGGLRSTAASAVFTLALMKSKAINPNKLSPASTTNQTQPERIWDLISRAFGVSGGAWMLIALSNGVLHELNSSWSIDQLVDHLHKTGIIRDGDFDSRTKEIHDKLLPKLGEVAADWHPVCCWCPDFCSCLQGMIDCVYNCFSGRPPYLLATAFNESTGEAGLCACKDDPLLELEKIIAPILLGGRENANKVIFDDDLSSIQSDMKRLGGNNNNSNNGNLYTPDLYVSAITSSSVPSLAKQYYWCHFKMNGTPKVVAHNPPPGCEEVSDIDLNRPLKLGNIAAFCGSAFSFDARCAAQHANHPLLQDIVNMFPFTTSAVLGGETVRKVELKKGSQKLGDLPNPAEMRDAGVDVNIAFLALNGYQAAWILDNGTESEMGVQIDLATQKGHIGHYDQVAVDMVKGWGIYCRNSTGERGPAIIIYVMGMNDVPLMNVRRAQERKMRAKELYVKWMEEIPKIIEVLEKIILGVDEHEGSQVSSSSHNHDHAHHGETSLPTISVTPASINPSSSSPDVANLVLPSNSNTTSNLMDNSNLASAAAAPSSSPSLAEPLLQTASSIAPADLDDDDL